MTDSVDPYQVPSAHGLSEPTSAHIKVAASDNDAPLDDSSFFIDIYTLLLESSDKPTSALDHPVVSPANNTPVGSREVSFNDGASKGLSSCHPNET